MINIRKDIKEITKQGPAKTKEFFALERKPSANWINTIEHGVDASQRVVDEYFKNQQVPAPALATTICDEMPGLVDVNDPKAPKSGPQAVMLEEPVIAEVIAGSPISKLSGMLAIKEGCTPEQIIQAAVDGKWNRRAVILQPLNADMNPYAHFGAMAQVMRQRSVGYEMEANTVLQRARNVLANRFLQSNAEWSFWLDGDTIAPWKGCSAMFYDKFNFNPRKVDKKFLDVNAIERLISHGKSIVGGVYRQRKTRGQLVCQFDLHPVSSRDKEIVKEIEEIGAINRIEPCGYVATGCCVIHRKVYEDIIAAHPDRKDETEKEVIFDFFGHNVGRGGEDIAFCKLAASAGHKSYLDLGLHCAHFGTHSFTP